jgi:hypothetical protein
LESPGSEGFDVPRKRAQGAGKKRGGKTSASSYSQHAISLLSQRDEQITEITMLRTRGPSSFLRKAEMLLTRYWARANWQGREEILRTVRWLLGMARLEAANAASERRTAKRTKRRSRALAPA